MRYWRVERFVLNVWMETDFRVSGQTEVDAVRHMEQVAQTAKWKVRLGREISALYNFCDFAWVNAT